MVVVWAMVWVFGVGEPSDDPDPYHDYGFQAKTETSKNVKKN